MEDLIDFLQTIDWEHLLAVVAGAVAAWFARHSMKEGRVVNGAGKKEPGIPLILEELHHINDRMEKLEKQGFLGRLFR